MSSVLYDPLAPCDYAELPDVVKQHYEPVTRLNGAGVAMHFPVRFIIVYCDPETGASTNNFFDVNSSNWRTGFREFAFAFTSAEQANLSARTMQAQPHEYGNFQFKVEPRTVFRCPVCCAAGQEPHKPNCTQQ